MPKTLGPPVSKVCPSCGGAAYRSVKPAALVAFTNDRVCLECQTRYAPPTPTWAAVVFLVLGLLPLLLGAAICVSVLIAAGQLGGQVNVLPVFFGVGLVVLGVLSIKYGLQALSAGKRS